MRSGKAPATGSTSDSLFVADLAQAYTEHADALRRRAFRYLRSEQFAEEVVQDAFIKVILAAPDLSSADHLYAYLNTTVTNLCRNLHAQQSRGPRLVAVDAETTREVLDDLAAETHVDLSYDLTAAEDGAIVREALSRLSASDRALLIAYEVDQKSNEEIAAMFNISATSVRNLVYRARKNLRNVLETWVIDEETGLTAAQYLSTAGRKIAENSKKIGGAALSLVLLVAAFFGFWNNPSTPVQIASPTTVTNVPQGETATPSVDVAQTPVATPTPEEIQSWALNFLAKTGPLGWPGLDSAGIPSGFTVNNGDGLNGLALISQEPFVMDTTSGQVSTQSRFTTFQDGINVILSQKVTNTFGKVSYQSDPMVRVGGSWISLEIASRSTEIKALSDGTYLITSFMIVDLDKTADNPPIAGMSLGGADLAHVPAVIATRLVTTSIGAPVIGQAVQVLDPLAGQ